MARLQNEIAPQKKIDTKNGLKNAKSLKEKNQKTRPKQFKPLSGRLKVFHRHFLNDFHRPNLQNIKYVFHREDLQGWHAKN